MSRYRTPIDKAAMRRQAEASRKRGGLFAGVSPGNVGNFFEVPPSNVTAYSTAAYGTPVRVLEINGEDHDGGIVTVSLQQERLLDDAESVSTGATLFDTVEGPLVGLVEFGAGAGLGTFEFDILPPVLTPGFINVDTGSVSITTSLLPWRRVNGVLLSLPASSMRVLVRNDANAPYLIRGLEMGNPVTVQLNGNKAAGRVRVHATYGQRAWPAKLTRSLPICCAALSDGSAGPTEPLAAEQGNVVDVLIPPYATKIYAYRAPLESTSLAVSFTQSALKQTGDAPSFTGQSILSAGDVGPIEIGPLDTFVRIQNAGPTDISNLILTFELGI